MEEAHRQWGWEGAEEAGKEEPGKESQALRRRWSIKWWVRGLDGGSTLGSQQRPGLETGTPGGAPAGCHPGGHSNPLGGLGPRGGSRLPKGEGTEGQLQKF